MSRIFCIVGKSATGKNTIFNEIISSNNKIIPVIPYTTRPMRLGETNHSDYNFVSALDLTEYRKKNLILEEREYHTTEGIWHYFTLKFDVSKEYDYILITTLDGALNIINYYGSNQVYLIYLSTDDKIRLLRSIERESKQKTPNYSEVCRRFIADESDFSDSILKKFNNIYTIDTSKSISNSLKKWNIIYGT